MRVIAFILFILVFGVFSLSGQSSTSYDVEFSRICLIDSIAPDTLTQFWRFTQANNPGGITRDYTYDLAGGYNVSGTVVPCCSCLTAASDTAALEVPGGLGTNNWGNVGILIFVVGMLGFLVLMNIWATTKAARFACTIFFLTLIPVSQGFAQSETLYDVEFTQICLIDSIAPDTIVQFWRFTHANNPGGITRDFTYDLSGAYIPTGTVIGCNDYYLGDNPEGSGTAGTLAIWTGTETLGNSSLTESAEEAVWDLTGALTLPSGTDAQVPVWGAGKLRYNTTWGGFQGGPSGYYLPWASVDNFTSNRIPYSDGSKLTSSADFTWSGTTLILSGGTRNLYLGTSGASEIRFNNNVAFRLAKDSGTGFDFFTQGSFDFYASDYRWSTVPVFAFRTNGQGANPNSADRRGLFQTDDIQNLEIGDSLVIHGDDNRISEIGPHTSNVVIRGGKGRYNASTDYGGGSVHLYPGLGNYQRPTSSNSDPGKLILFCLENDSTYQIGLSFEQGGILAPNTIYTTTGIKTLTIENDTIKHRVENLGTISTSTDGSGDITVAHGMGTTPTSVQVTVTGTTPYVVTVHSIDATNFTVRFYDVTGAAVTSTAVTATWHAKT